MREDAKAKSGDAGHSDLFWVGCPGGATQFGFCEYEAYAKWKEEAG